MLGGSFTGDLAVDPAHKRDLRQWAEGDAADRRTTCPGWRSETAAERRRRIRDAVEASLSDIILLGTEEQVRLAERAARDLVAGRKVHTHELVVSLRNYIRSALELEPVPDDLADPVSGADAAGSSGGSKGGGGGDGAVVAAAVVVAAAGWDGRRYGRRRNRAWNRGWCQRGGGRRRGTR